jgi:hypothetical protein
MQWAIAGPLEDACEYTMVGLEMQSDRYVQA